MEVEETRLRIKFSPGHVELVEEQVTPPARKVVVTGATGLLGRAVCREFQDGGWSVLGTGFRRARPRLLYCDLLDEDAVHSLVHDHKPDVIVHCAAERRPDVVERHTEAAVNLNVHATSTLANEAGSAGVFLLYISSDYVFDGRNPPYGEDDAPNPLNQYGRSKLEGEREVLRLCPGSCVLRVPVLFGEVQGAAESAVTALWPAVLQGEPESCNLDHCMQRFPTDCRDVAAVCRKLAERRLEDPSIRGIFHFSSKEQMTKYQMAVAMAEAFSLPSNHLIPVESPGSAQRPVNAQLACGRLEQLALGVKPRPFRDAITSCLWPFLPDKVWRQTVFH